MADIFFDNRTVSFNISKFVLSDNDLQFVSKFFALLCADPGVMHLPKKAYNQQTSDQAKRFQHTIVTRLLHFVIDDQQNWEAIAWWPT